MNEYNEPWIAAKNGIDCDDGSYIAGSSYLETQLMERIVACVNFCAGVSNEELAKLPLSDILRERENLLNVGRAMSVKLNNLATEASIKDGRPILPPAFMSALKAHIEEVAFHPSCPDGRLWSAVEAANRGEVR